MNRIFFVLSTLLALAIQFPAQSQTYTYTNPVISGFNPDPSVVRVGEDYYLVTSSFCYFPGLPIYHSKNLVDWELIGYGLHRSNQIDLHETKIWSGIYAPTIRYHQGKFYIITTNTKRDRNFIISADNPAGPWSDPVTVPIDGYDPSLYFEDDQALVTWTGDYKESHGILQAAVDVETLPIPNTDVISSSVPTILLVPGPTLSPCPLMDTTPVYILKITRRWSPGPAIIKKAMASCRQQLMWKVDNC